MVDVSYPGVYREELENRQQVTQGTVSTSNLAIVGFFEKGPVNEPILVQSPREAEEVFGGPNSKSIAPTILDRFFQNGGSQAFVVRVTGDGAAKATGAQTTNIYDEDLSDTQTSTTITLGATLANTPVYKNSVNLNLHNVSTQSETGIADSNQSSTISATLSNTPVYGESVEITMPDDASGTITITEDGDGILDEEGGNSEVGQINYKTGEFEIDPTELSATPAGSTSDVDATYGQSAWADQLTNDTLDEETANQRVYHGDIRPRTLIQGSVQFKWTDQASVDQTATAYPDGNIFDDTDDPATADPIGTFDWNSGEYTINTGALEDDSELEADYSTWDYLVISDDGNGNLDGDNVASAGTIDYETGDIENLEIDSTDFQVPVLANYEYKIHLFSAVNVGDIGNNFRVRIVGNPNFLNNDTGQYEAFTVFVDEDRGGNIGFVNLESFSEVTLTDPTEDSHISHKINDNFLGSEKIEVVPELGTEIPIEVQGSSVSGVLVDVGDGSKQSTTVDLHLKDDFVNFDEEGNLLQGSLSITYTDTNGESREITDDSQGNLIGDVEAGGTVNYQNGVVQFTPQYAPQSGSDIEAAFAFQSSNNQADNGFSGGDDGGAISKDHVTNFDLKADKEGIYALDSVSGELLILSAPDFAGDAVAERSMIAYAEDREDTMVITAPPEGSDPEQALNYKRNVLGSQSGRAAMYHPWITIQDPLSTNTKNIPPIGHAAGVWARTDANRNIGKAPAGTEDGVLFGLVGFNQIFTKEEVGQMYEGNINSLWQPPGRPRVVWGARTLQTGGEYRYIQRRRTMDFTAVTIKRSLWWTVFENVGPSLWAAIREQVRSILQRGFNQGLYRGQSEQEAFDIQINAQNNPPEVQARGEVVLEWAVALNTPAEFIRMKHRQKTLV